MDWSNTKRATIVLFLLLNIVLYTLNNYRLKELYEVDEATLDKVKTILSDSNIELKKEPTLKYYPLSKLNLKEKEAELKNVGPGIISKEDNSLIYKEINPRNVYEEDKIRGIVYNFAKIIDKNVELTDYYVINDETDEKENAYIFKFNTKYKDKYIFGSYIDVRYTRGKIEEAKINLYNVKNEEEVLNIKSSVNVLSKFKYIKDEEDIDTKIVIRDMSLGYSKTGYPMYRIITEDNNFYYFNAYTNELESR